MHLKIVRQSVRMSWLFLAIFVVNPLLLLASPQKAEQKKIPTVPVPQDTEIALDELAGVVVDTDGEPIADVLVDAWSWYPGNETRTDKSGRFRLKMGDATSKIEVRFMKAGYSPHYIIQQQLGVDNFSVTLGQKTYIEGIVRDPKGKPVPNVEIRGEQSAKEGDGVMIGSVATLTKTDASGKYRLYAFPDQYQLLISAPKVGVKRVTGVVVKENEAKQLDIDLEQGVRFEARIVDSESGEPVQDVVLWNWQQLGVKGISDATGLLVIEEMLPGDFEFNIGEGEPVQFGSIQGYLPRTVARWWSADASHKHQQKLVEAKQFQRNFDDLTFKLNVGMEPVTIAVEQGVTFSGKVLDPNGKPVQGATVAPAKTGSGNSLTGDTRFSTKTDAEGKYRVVMPAGNWFQYNLMAHDGDYQEWRTWANGVGKPMFSSPGEVYTDMDLTLTHPTTVRGQLLLNGKPLKVGTSVSAQSKDLLENRYYNPTTLVNEDGSFELKFIRAGEHSIRVGQSTIDVVLEPGQILEGVELKY